MIKARLPKSFDLLLLWHGLFAGSYTIAYLTAEGAEGLHRFAGYTVIGLLGLRLLVAAVASERSPWTLPWPTAGMWRVFLRKLSTADVSVLRSRTPLAPLSGLVILVAVVLAGLSGLTADWWEWKDLHEGLAEGSLPVVLIHIAIVSLAPALKRLSDSRSGRPQSAVADNA